MSWRRVRTLIRREVLATFRDPFTLMVLVCVPLGALLAFGSLLSVDVHNMPLGVHDADGSAASRRLIAELAAQGTFDVRPFATRQELDEAMIAGDVGAVLVIPPDFARGLAAAARGGPRPQVQAQYDGGEAVLAGNAEAFLLGLVATTGAELVASHLPVPARGMPSDRGIEVVSRAAFNPTLDGKPFMVAGTFGFVLSFVTVLITAVSIVNERLTGTFEQLQVTPATALEILLGKLLPYGGVFAIDVVLMTLVAGFVMGVWPAGSLVFFIVVSTFYVLVSLALGLIISATSATAGEAVQKTVLLSIPLVQLSGFAFAIRNMPTPVQWLAEIFPATHYIRICRAIYLRAEGPVSLAPEIAMLALFGMVLMAIALRSIEARA